MLTVDLGLPAFLGPGLAQDESDLSNWWGQRPWIRLSSINADSLHFNFYIYKLRCNAQSNLKQLNALGYKLIDSFEALYYLILSSKAPMN